MKSWIETQARQGAYSNSSDYIRDLVRRDQDQKGALRKVPINLFGSKVTIVGDFRPIAIVRDLAVRGAHPSKKLDADTRYVLVGNGLTNAEQQIIAVATDAGIPCVTLDHYKSQLPDALEIDAG